MTRRALAIRSPMHPGSTLATVGYRAIMVASAARLTARRDSSSRALRRALLTAALGRFAADERTWIERLEARRAALVADPALVRADIRDGTDIGPDPTEEPSVPVGTASLWMSLPPVWCGFLLRLVRELRPRSCVELGTGFGISGAYAGAALELNDSGRLTTIDRAGGFAAIAEQGFSELGLGERVDPMLGPIDDLLAETAPAIAPVEYALLDADHTEEATVRHFEALLGALAPGAVAVVDDINWGMGGMREAWRRIASNDRVAVAIGMRKLGVVVISDRDG